ncbi:MAG: D-isomer specific 2-hydroxyacid dehydrogenase [Monoraphidium minutum]|nr:MAG: D-isomer specific 2-hydroxyacid dehydrogenase [Monoraphidium minutum]
MDAGSQEDETWPVIWCYDGWHPLREMLERILPPWAALRVLDPSRPLCEQCADAKVLIPTTGTVDAAAIGAARGLRLIAQPAAGYANIDVAAARARGVPVTIAPGYNRHSTAEAALMLMLMLARRIDATRAAFAARRIGDPPGTELHGKTLGIIGMGQVGGCLAAAARGIGMRVIHVGSKSSRVDLEALLASADVISLHVHSTPTTRGLIGARELALMRPAALLVNTARGDVIDDAALLSALQAGRLGGVGLDVHTMEPADPGAPLYRHPKVLALPHCGAATEEVYQRFAELLRDNIAAARAGAPLRHRLC